MEEGFVECRRAFRRELSIHGYTHRHTHTYTDKYTESTYPPPVPKPPTLHRADRPRSASPAPAPQHARSSTAPFPSPFLLPPSLCIPHSCCRCRRPFFLLLCKPPTAPPLSPKGRRRPCLHLFVCMYEERSVVNTSDARPSTPALYYPPIHSAPSQPIDTSIHHKSTSRCHRS